MHSDLSRALQDIDDAAGRLAPDILGQAAGGRWSIAGILEHLTLAFTVNRRAMEKVLASGDLRARAPRLAERLARVLLVNVGYFPRVEAPEVTRPTGGIPPDASLAAIREALTALDATLARAAVRFGEDVRVANHPYFGGLTVRQWRRFHRRHTRHHMRQIRARVARAPET